MMRSYLSAKLHTASALHCHRYNAFKKKSNAPNCKSIGNFIILAKNTVIFYAICYDFVVMTAGSLQSAYTYIIVTFISDTKHFLQVQTFEVMRTLTQHGRLIDDMIWLNHWRHDFLLTFHSTFELFWEVRRHPSEMPHHKVPDGTVPPVRGQVWWPRMVLRTADYPGPVSAGGS